MGPVVTVPRRTSGAPQHTASTPAPARRGTVATVPRQASRPDVNPQDFPVWWP